MLNNPFHQLQIEFRIIQCDIIKITRKIVYYYVQFENILSEHLRVKVVKSKPNK